MPNYEITPSFRYKVREAIREYKYFKLKKYFDPIMSLDVKDAAYKFCQNNDIPIPVLYSSNFKLEDFPLDIMPDNFVLKPLSAHSSFGVFLLVKVGSNQYKNLIDNTIKSLDEFLDFAKDIMLDKKFPNNWMLEELLLPVTSEIGSVDDWKFYTFYGECPLILQKHRKEDGGIEYQWYDQNWDVVTNTGRYRESINHQLSPPKNADQLLSLALKVSKLIPSKFMRVDLFETHRGPILGEFTPFPGGFSMFYSSYDKFLGECWLESESRLHWDYKAGKAFQKIENIRKTIK